MNSADQPLNDAEQALNSAEQAQKNPDQLVEIALLRHGLTAANELHCYCGQTDLPLSETGIRALQANRLSNLLPAVSVCFHSGLKRTRETAEILFGQYSPIMLSLPDWQEFNFGKFEMKSHDMLQDDPDYQHWIGDIATRPCPGGENLAHFRHRIACGWQKILDELRERNPGQAAAITHGGVIVDVMTHFFPAEEKHYYDWQPACGDGYLLVLNLATGQVIAYSALTFSLSGAASGND